MQRLLPGRSLTKTSNLPAILFFPNKNPLLENVNFLPKLFSSPQTKPWGGSNVQSLADQQHNCTIYLFKLAAAPMPLNSWLSLQRMHFCCDSTAIHRQEFSKTVESLPAKLWVPQTPFSPPSTAQQSLLCSSSSTGGMLSSLIPAQDCSSGVTPITKHTWACQSRAGVPQLLALPCLPLQGGLGLCCLSAPGPFPFARVPLAHRARLDWE